MTSSSIHQPQPWTVQLYSEIEDWWGEKLTSDLADKASNAPSYQIAAFADHLSTKLTDSSPTLGPMSPGTLRPLVGSNLIDGFGSKAPLDSGIALRLLLYVHEVVLASEPLDPLLSLNSREINGRTRRMIRHNFSQLANLRPFALDGLLHFTIVHSPALHPAFSLWETDSLQRPEVWQFAQRVALERGASPEEADDQSFLRSILTYCFSSLKMGIMRMADGSANPLTRTQSERELLRTLMTQGVNDRRHTAVGTLAQLPVPDFTNDAGLLTKLREDDEKFAAWRQSLGSALAQVGDLPDSANLSEATDIVRSELMSALSAIKTSTNKSAVLRAASQGVAQFGMGAVGALSSGLVTGNPTTGALVGAAGTQLGSIAVNTIKGLREKRSDRLVLALAAEFNTAEEP